MSKKPDDHPVLGTGYALGAAFFLSVVNLLSKLLSDVYAPVEIIFYRNLIALILLAAGLVILRKRDRFRTERPKSHLIRAAIGTIGAVLSVWTFKLLPLSSATAILFTAPLFVVLFSYPLLKEKVGLYRMLAVIVGFGGVVFIVGPNGDIPFSGLLIGFCAAMAVALVSICLRWLGQTESAATTNFYFLFFGLLGTGAFMPFIATTPTAETLPLILSLGTIGLFSLLLKTQGFRLGKAAIISPISYTLLIWAVLYDYLFWDLKPNSHVLAGATIIIASNLFILWRERQVKKLP